LPDRLLAWDGENLAAVPYEDLEARARTISFVEDRTWGLPSDALRIGSTWRYVNRDGGRDLRFKDNAELPVMEYGELELQAHSGLRIVLQTSTSAAAEGAALALQGLSQRAAKPMQTPMILRAPTIEPPPPTAAPPLEPPTPASARSMGILLRYLAAADRRIDASEHELAAQRLSLLAPADPELSTVISHFRELPSDQDAVRAAAREVLSSPQRAAMVSALERLSGIDGKATPKELERLRELRRLLNA
jgi:hypothetical protein